MARNGKDETVHLKIFKDFCTFMAMTHHFHFSVVYLFSTGMVKAIEHQVKQLATNVNSLSENHSK